jgi:hypothetical protein
MKRLNFLILIMLCCVKVNAQFTKGTFLFGGSIGGSYSTSTSTIPFNFRGLSPPIVYADKSISSISLSPQIGYFVANNFCAGLRLGWSYSYTNEKYFSVTNFTSRSIISVEPFIRYYIEKYFIQGTFGLGSVTGETYQASFSNEILKENTNSILGSISVGRAFLISKQLAIEPLAGYQFTKFSNKEIPDEKVGTFYLAVGLQYYLSK